MQRPTLAFCSLLFYVTHHLRNQTNQNLNQNPNHILMGGGGGVRNVRYLERRNLVRRKFGTTSQIPQQNLVQNSQIVAQEQAYTATVGFLMLAIIS